MKNLHTDTHILHSIPVDELTGAISVPIYQTSTFVQEAPGINKGFDYSRTNNPTRAALEKILSQLESGHAGFAFASGLAAIDAVLKLLSAGDQIIACNDIYGGSFRLFTHIYQKFGIDVIYTDTSDINNIKSNITARTKCIWIESPTNPTLKITDLSAVAKLAEECNALFVVDNTFATPLGQKPLELGAHIVIHSATKYLGGHSDIIAGAVITGNEALSEKIKFIQNASGAVLGPFDSWLLIRGIETLSVRFEKHNRNADQVARWLQNHEAVDQIFYPGLPTHSHYETAQRQQNGGGSIISFSLKEDTLEAAEKVVCSTQLFKLAESLGGVKSLLCHPAQMTHKSIPESRRKAAGIQNSLIRLSVGLEHPQDLISDLEQALAVLETGKYNGYTLKQQEA